MSDTICDIFCDRCCEIFISHSGASWSKLRNESKQRGWVEYIDKNRMIYWRCPKCVEKAERRRKTPWIKWRNDRINNIAEGRIIRDVKLLVFNSDNNWNWNLYRGNANIRVLLKGNFKARSLDDAKSKALRRTRDLIYQLSNALESNEIDFDGISYTDIYDDGEKLAKAG